MVPIIFKSLVKFLNFSIFIYIIGSDIIEFKSVKKSPKRSQSRPQTKPEIRTDLESQKWVFDNQKSLFRRSHIRSNLKKMTLINKRYLIFIKTTE